jgi:hypothetical protein
VRLPLAAPPLRDFSTDGIARVRVEVFASDQQVAEK